MHFLYYSEEFCDLTGWANLRGSPSQSWWALRSVVHGADETSVAWLNLINKWANEKQVEGGWRPVMWELPSGDKAVERSDRLAKGEPCWTCLGNLKCNEVERSRSKTMMQLMKHMVTEKLCHVSWYSKEEIQVPRAEVASWRDGNIKQEIQIIQLKAATSQNSANNAWNRVRAQQRLLPNIAGHRGTGQGSCPHFPRVSKVALQCIIKLLNMHLCKDERSEACACQSLPWICSFVPHKLRKSNIRFKQKYKWLFSFSTKMFPLMIIKGHNSNIYNNNNENNYFKITWNRKPENTFLSLTNNPGI